MAFWGTVGEFFSRMEYLGFFEYVLPFLLIFALVYLILMKSKVLGGEQYKGANAIIALAVGLIALRIPLVSDFFTVIFPRLGVGLAVLLAALISIGLFVKFDQESDMGNKVFFWIGVVIAAWIGLSTFADFSWWGSGFFFQQYMDWIVIGIILIVVILIITRTGGSATPNANRGGG